MEIIMIFATALVVGFSGAMVPGPLLTLTVSETVRRGFMAGPMIVLGHAVLELSLIIALVAGCSVYLQKDSVFTLIALAGGALLLYMGAVMARDAWRGTMAGPLSEIGSYQAGATASATLEAYSPAIEFPSSGKDRVAPGSPDNSGLHPVLGGFLVSLANPYWSLWWISIGLGYITLALKNGFSGLVSFFSGHILADLTWYCLVAAAVAGGRKFMSDAVYRNIQLVCGVFLLALGLYFFYLGLFK